MGFWRQQEEKMAVRLLRWHFEREGQATPPDDRLKQQAADLVDQAHRVAKKRGQNVIVILKDLVKDLRR